MTDTFIQKALTDEFLTLSDFSGKPYIQFDAEGKPLNVALPNTAFVPPKSRQFFVLYFLPDSPEPAAMGTDAGNRWEGIFQIDVCTPLGKGEAEANDKYEWISKMFARGKAINGVLIRKCYRALTRVDIEHFTAVIRVEWTAELEK
jgi:hypothetical protein